MESPKIHSVTKILFALFVGLALSLRVAAQQNEKIAIVLSGGGASAYAHIGFLKALEEKGVPIHSITGVSMGAIIGGLYASGYSPSDIEQLLTSETFIKEISGLNENAYRNLFKDQLTDASWINLKINPEGQIGKNLPTHLFDPLYLDLILLEHTVRANAAANCDFDSLLVPFRCVASDVENKQDIVFSSGYLNRAIRTSSTYPFYVRPIVYQDKLLFDGGLYNNFPTNVAIDSFDPDIIIGCNVSYNYTSPEKDDLISQVKNMLVSKSDYSLRGKKGIIITPEDDIETFDFDRAKEAIVSGYEATINAIDSIRNITQQVDPYQEERRAKFRKKLASLKIEKLESTGITDQQQRYISKALVRKKGDFEIEGIKENYLALISDPFIQYVFPDAYFNEESNKYTLKLEIDLEKSLEASFGGNISNKSINTGFVSLAWKNLSYAGLIVSANSYFGKYYSSVNADIRLIKEGRFPLSIRPYVTFNRWDYFRSRTSFFEDVKPAFVIENEQFTGLEVSTPTSKTSYIFSDIRYVKSSPNYYLESNFSNADTSDQTIFNAGSYRLGWEFNTLDQKQYATAGKSIRLNLAFTEGRESYIPGSTSPVEGFLNKYKRWAEIRFSYKQFIPLSEQLIFYPMIDGRISSLYSFSNFRASEIFLPQYNPLTESATLFLPQFRSVNNLGLGAGLVFKLTDRLGLRTQHHLFLPFNTNEQTEGKLTEFGGTLSKRYYVAGGAAVYQTPLGPLAANINYFEGNRKPWSFMINFGYILFNQRGL
ncbi:patatin-like phospholipase family protein [Luteibaculum oceani]|uniref:PNPLA domain-containing protein n=1 Tax=Luteibaculum oceani TaxID=1294296 RepID=A0A5C6VEP2_9FLAO|nr:patatin-like phospholipase family protein [Luteibaculum oceani]TXC81618.1 hypothetical protein FRX97_03600 [Luteibaculum oceani]